MYPLLRQGDRLPSVAAVQILINRAMRHGEQIAVDGIFGPRTAGALRDFQAAHGLDHDAVVGRDTWTALTQGQDLQVIDAVDVTDPQDMGYWDEDIRAAGGDPIVSFGMCSGVRHVRLEIMARARAGRVVLLRFLGHGAPGLQGVTIGRHGYPGSDLDTRFLDSMVRALSQMQPIFCGFGSVELHGCRVGAGAVGQRLLRGLSGAWGVPVSAGVQSQLFGGSSTFRFEGPTVTACPHGASLRSWAQALPEAAQMSVDQ